MPIVKGKRATTPKGFSDNVRKMKKEGKSTKQSVAIAYSEADKSKKKGADIKRGLAKAKAKRK